MTWLVKGLLTTALFVGMVLGLGALVESSSQASEVGEDASVSEDAATDGPRLDRDR